MPYPIKRKGEGNIIIAPIEIETAPAQRFSNAARQKGGPDRLSGRDLTERERIELIKKLREHAVVLDSKKHIGSGVIIHAGKKGTAILTNGHVVVSRSKRVPQLEIHNEGLVAPVSKILLAPRPLDLALVIGPPGIGSAIDFEWDTDFEKEVQIGSKVLVVGASDGIPDTVSSGIISNLLPTEARKVKYYLIQTDAAVNQGNSGGPMVLERTRKLIGIVTSKADAEGIAFALPITVLNEFPIEKWREVK